MLSPFFVLNSHFHNEQKIKVPNDLKGVNEKFQEISCRN